MIGRKVPGARQVSRKECRELSKLAWVLDKALSDDTFEARLLPDGRLLLYLRCDERGTLYPSRESLEKMRREFDEMVAKRPLGIDTLLPPIDDFLRDVEAHAKSLGARLRIPNEVLDGSEASLEAVDNALKRMRKPKRLTPEIITPLVAYVGEVMRPVCGGRWGKFPPTEKKQVPVFDPVEYAAWQARQSAQLAAGFQAEAAVKARGGSETAQGNARNAIIFGSIERAPTPIRFNVVEVPIRGHDNEPVIEARDGWRLQPYVMVFVPMVEPSKRRLLRDSVDAALMRYRPAKQAGGSTT